MVLKITVLESGAVLLDGTATDVNRLDERLGALKAAGGIVWYYREPTANPEAVGMSVIKKVVAHKLAISMSSKPDFSDYLDTKGVSHPRGQATPAGPGGAPGMPAVAIRDDIEEVFAKARATAAGEKGPRGLVMVRPDRGLFVLPALAESKELNAQAAGMERMIPSAVKRNIAVIGDTAFTAETAAPNLADANRSIPFFGMLIGLSYIGHHVWVFEGHPSALSAGCRDADLLLVDGALLPRLGAGWDGTAAAAMRNANILVQDRSTFKLKFVRKVGSGGGLEFAR